MDVSRLPWFHPAFIMVSRILYSGARKISRIILTSVTSPVIITSEISEITFERVKRLNPIMTVRAPDALRIALKRAAHMNGITLNALILQILWDWMERRKMEV